MRIAENIIVSGREEDISSIKNNSLYLKRVYKGLFGKTSYLKKFGENQYIVLKVELKNKELGGTPWALTKDDKEKIR